MNAFKKLSVSALIFAIIYTICMYHNRASVTFPIMMAAGIALLYFICGNRKPFDNKLSGFYNIMIMLLSVSVFMTDDWKLIFMTKCIVFVLYLCLATELFYDDSTWQDIHYIKNIFKLIGESIGKGFLYPADRAVYKQEQKEKRTEEKPKNQNAVKILKGFLISIPLLVIIIPLMMSADVVFMNLMENVFNFKKVIELFFHDFNIIYIIFYILISFTLFYGLIKTLTCSGKKTMEPCIRKSDTVTAVTVTGIVAVVYGLFSFIQIRGILFSNVSLPENYTYAQYAREGFFQLFVLALINMAIVLFCASRYEHNKILQGILYVLCAFTYVMIFASAFKMFMYIGVYNLTFLRIMVLWALLVIAVIMAAVIRYIYRNDFSLFRFAVITVTSFYLLIAFGRPDYITAKYNLDYGNPEYPGWYYLKYLSCDAMPVMVEHKEEMRKHDDGYYMVSAKKQYEDMSLRTFNLSQFVARELTK